MFHLRSQHHFQQTLRTLEEALFHLKSGGVDPLSQSGPLPEGFRQILQRNLDEGMPLVRGIENFMAIARAMSRQMTLSRRLKTLILTRWLFVVFLGVVVRIYFVLDSLRSEAPLAGGSWGVTLMSRFFAPDFQGAVLLAVWSLGGMMMLQPKNWLWNVRSWTPLASRWLASFIGGIAEKDDPWFSKVDHYSNNEFMFGVSLLTEKQQILLDFATQKADELQKKHQFLEELIPLWELLTLAPVMFVMMALPATRWVVGI